VASRRKNPLDVIASLMYGLRHKVFCRRSGRVESSDLEQLESEAYRATYADGIIDIYFGASAIWIGAVWVLFPDFGGLAGILPAVFVTVMLAGRQRFVESRSGYVKWSASRRRWEHRNLAATLVAGIALLLTGIGVFVLYDGAGSASPIDAITPGLLALLLALAAVAIGFLIGTWRMFLYAAVLTVTGLVTAWADANPGWPLLTSGIFIAAAGIVMLVRFLRRYSAAPAS
jgi:hypothetical protein